VAPLARAVQIVPGSADGRNTLGAALMTEGRSREAIEQFRRALEISPAMSAARTNLERPRATP
jgi:Flp pilus assembly protein TadD